MSNRALWILSVVAAVLLAFSYVAAGNQPVMQIAFVSGRNLIPDIDTDRVHDIEIEGWGQQTRLSRQGDHFVVASRNNYPADAKAINDLVRACLKVRCDDQITDNPERYANLNVSWPSGRAHRVRYLDASGAVLVGLIVSDVITGKVQGNYVRLADSDTVYRTDNNIDISSDPLDYLDKRLLPVEIPDIARIEINHEDHFVIEQDADGKRSLTGIPSDMQPMGLAYTNILALAPRIEFEDFVPVRDKQDLDFSKTFQVDMRSKIRYLLRTAEQDGKYWVVASAQYFGPSRPQISADSSIEEIRQATEYKQAFEDANAYNRRHSGRAYRVHKRFVIGLMAQSLAPLIEKKSK